MATQRIIAGYIDKEGKVLSGEGFDVTREIDKGHYTIELTEAKTKIIGFAATQIYPDDGNTRDNVIIITLGRNKVLIKTGNGDGNGEYRSFSFVAVATAPDEVAPK